MAYMTTGWISTRQLGPPGSTRLPIHAAAPQTQRNPGALYLKRAKYSRENALVNIPIRFHRCTASSRPFYLADRSGILPRVYRRFGASPPSRLGGLGMRAVFGFNRVESSALRRALLRATAAWDHLISRQLLCFCRKRWLSRSTSALHLPPVSPPGRSLNSFDVEGLKVDLELTVHVMEWVVC